MVPNLIFVLSNNHTPAKQEYFIRCNKMEQTQVIRTPTATLVSQQLNQRQSDTGFLLIYEFYKAYFHMDYTEFISCIT